jgi:hypothetical protein
VANYAFDVTPARLVTGLITERGLLGPSVLHLRAHSRSAARDIDAGDVGTYPRSGLSYRGSRLHVQYRHRNRRRGSDRTGGRFACGDQRSRGDVVVSLLLLALALTLGYDNWRTGAGWESTGPQSGYFPFYLSVILGGASLYGLVAAFLSRKEASEVFVTRAQLRRVMAVFVPTLLFCLAMQFLGLYVASFLLIAGFMRMVGKIALWKSLLTAFVFTAVMFVTFDIAFDVIMPKGPLEAALGR